MARRLSDYEKVEQYVDEDYATSNTPIKLFDVTCVVGSVYSGGDTDETPREAAFRLIARHGADGTFSFPEADGSTAIVTVETTKGN